MVTAVRGPLAIAVLLASASFSACRLPGPLPLDGGATTTSGSATGTSGSTGGATSTGSSIGSSSSTGGSTASSGTTSSSGTSSGGSSSGTSAPALQVFGLTGVMAAGATHTCAVANGGVWCWGDNDYGQLGVDTGDEGVSLVPLPGGLLLKGAF